jgi:N-acetylmuramoyl-L-alanine amidase
MEIKNNKLLDARVKHFCCSKNKKYLDDIKFLIVHYTASFNKGSTIDHLINPNTQVSAHILIDREGNISQLLAFSMQAWHAGHSEYGSYTHLNRYSIGIELMNMGKLSKRDGKYYSYFGKQVSEDKVFAYEHTNKKISYWEKYPEKQIEALAVLIRDLLRTYPYIEDILGHSEINKGKIDPGKAFPWTSLNKRINTLSLS